MKFLLFILLNFSSPAEHKFYVSLTDVHYNSTSEHVEVSSKVFIDDLERALALPEGEHISEPMDRNLSALMSDYMSEHLDLTIDRGTCALAFLGYEIEEDVVWLFLESDKIPRPSEVVLRSTVLVRDFPEQQNIVHFNLEGTIHSLFLSEANPVGTILFD